MKKYDYFLDACPGFGDKTKNTIRRSVKNSKEVYDMSEGELLQLLNKEKVKDFLQHRESWNLQEEYKALEKQGIRLVSLFSEEYPGRLGQIPNPPFALYVRGGLPREDVLSVAVIGARECSEYGAYVADSLGKFLGEQGISLISGMARGIDGISQTAALKAGGTSFGVLGCGVDVCYPKSNKVLYDSLLKKGGIISSYLPGTAPKASLFPPRNRIVSGLCDVLVVVEARQRSGTSITVEMALEQGRDVYAVPGRLTDRLSDGCNRMLKDGAQIFLSPKEFAEELSMRYGAKFHLKNKGRDNHSCKAENLSGLELMVYQELDLYPMPMEEILEKIKRKKGDAAPELSELISTLMGLCVRGLVVQNASGWFSKSL